VVVTATRMLTDFNEMLKATETDALAAGRAYEVFKLQLEQLQAAGLINAEQFNARMGEFLDKALPEEQITATKIAIEKAYNEMNVFADEAARNMQGAFANFLFDPFGEGLEGMLKGFLDVIRRMAAEAAAAQIFQHLFGGSGGLGSILGGLFGGAAGALGGPATNLGGALGLPQLASGGPINGPAIVGERGPELFVPGTAGHIIPNGGFGGGLTYAPVINAQGADASLRAALPGILQEHGKRMMSHLRDQMERGAM
jgi:hypothetical protein